MSPTEIAVLTFILSAFAVFIVTLAWVSRRPRLPSRAPLAAQKGPYRLAR